MPHFFFLVLLQFSILFLNGLDLGAWTLLLNRDSSWGTRGFDVQGLQAARRGRLTAVSPPAQDRRCCLALTNVPGATNIQPGVLSQHPCLSLLSPAARSTAGTN